MRRITTLLWLASLIAAYSIGVYSTFLGIADSLGYSVDGLADAMHSEETWDWNSQGGY